MPTSDKSEIRAATGTILLLIRIIRKKSARPVVKLELQVLAKDVAGFGKRRRADRTLVLK